MSYTDPLGYDAFVREDMDPGGRAASGLELLEAALLHRLMTDKLLMVEASPDGQIDFGRDLRKWIGEATTADSAAAKGPYVEEVLRRDPRVASASASVSIASGTLSDGSRVGLLVDYSVTTIAGQQIRRIVGISSVTVEYLATGGS